jgi:outer membrane lipoprotein SlyB
MFNPEYVTPALAGSPPSRLDRQLDRRQRLAMVVGGLTGLALGSSAGVAFGGSAYSAALLAAAVGALVGLVAVDHLAMAS